MAHGTWSECWLALDLPGGPVKSKARAKLAQIVARGSALHCTRQRASFEELDLWIERRRNVRPWTVRSLELHVDKRVQAVRCNGELAAADACGAPKILVTELRGHGIVPAIPASLPRCAVQRSSSALGASNKSASAACAIFKSPACCSARWATIRPIFLQRELASSPYAANTALLAPVEHPPIHVLHFGRIHPLNGSERLAVGTDRIAHDLRPWSIAIGKARPKHQFVAIPPRAEPQLGPAQRPVHLAAVRS